MDDTEISREKEQEEKEMEPNRKRRRRGVTDTKESRWGMKEGEGHEIM
jgi:hypothetical protein